MGYKKYPDELRARATRMPLDARQDPDTARGAITRVAERLGVHGEALRVWVRHAEIDGGVRPGTTTDDATRIAELEKEVRELRRAYPILKSASAFFAAELALPTQVTCDCIDAHKAEYGVEPLCRTLRDAGGAIAPSTYCATRS